jgi:hypothetical protein
MLVLLMMEKITTWQMNYGNSLSKHQKVLEFKFQEVKMTFNGLKQKVVNSYNR